MYDRRDDEKKIVEYSNPRMEATIKDWPTGNTRTTAIFKIEQHRTRGERATRVTINPKTGRPNAPKVLTYATHMRIVDGDDGRTYILELSQYGTLRVMQSNMQFQAEVIDPKDPRRERLLDLCAARKG